MDMASIMDTENTKAMVTERDMEANIMVNMDMVMAVMVILMELMVTYRIRNLEIKSGVFQRRFS